MKLFEIVNVMKRRRIDVLCLQEAHVSQSPYYTTAGGYLVVLSGSPEAGREFAGVGFVVAPWRHVSVFV